MVGEIAQDWCKQLDRTILSMQMHFITQSVYFYIQMSHICHLSLAFMAFMEDLKIKCHLFGKS